MAKSKESDVIHMGGFILAPLSIVIGTYVMYSAFRPSLISRPFFDETGSPVEYIPFPSFAGILVLGLCLLGGGIFLTCRVLGRISGR